MMEEHQNKKLKTKKKLRYQHDDSVVSLSRLMGLLQTISGYCEKQAMQTALFIILDSGMFFLEKGAIFLVLKKNELTMIAHKGLNPPSVKECSTVSFGDCSCGIAAQDKKSIFCQSCKSSKKKDHKKHGHYVVPIQGSNKILGVLNIYLNPNRMTYSKHREEFVKALAINLAGILGRIEANNKLKEAYDKIEKLANIDPLTQILNRRGFEEALRAILRQIAIDRRCKGEKRDNNDTGRRTEQEKITISAEDAITVIFVDIGNFKNFNTTHGHEGGDQTLKIVAQRMDANTQRSWEVSARWGGEEFIAIIRGGWERAQLILEKVNQPFFYKGQKLSVTINMGCVTLPTCGTITTDTIIDKADQRMYLAKNNDPDRNGSYVYRNGDNEIIVKRFNPTTKTWEEVCGDYSHKKNNGDIVHATFSQLT